MASTTRVATDLVEEFVLRRWAREHYVPVDERNADWHAVVLDEMDRKDREVAEAAEYALSGRRIVPLVPEADWTLHGPHAESARAPVLLQIPNLVIDQPCDGP
ncbi:MAG TPA: hypothetical protein VL475_03095 [Planctomycetaceae bacterium]|nr:hypothetical protein [Planctomycetaceae bacterium]